MSRDSESSLDAPPWLVPLVYGWIFLLVGAFYLVLYVFWGEYVLLDFQDLNKTGLSFAGLAQVWFIFVWAAVATLVIYKLNGRPVSYDSKPVQIGKGLWLSLNAGVWEELIYRWLVFFSAMITLPFLDWITGGFIWDNGVISWVYEQLLVPLANWSTFGALEPFLLGDSNWVFGAAIVSASMAFRDEHKHLGLIGWVNAWYMGMVMFWLVLNYGLVTAIVAHVVYDAIIFTLQGAMSVQAHPFSYLMSRKGKAIRFGGSRY